MAKAVVQDGAESPNSRIRTVSLQTNDSMIEGSHLHQLYKLTSWYHRQPVDSGLPPTKLPPNYLDKSKLQAFVGTHSRETLREEQWVQGQNTPGKKIDR